MFRHEEPSAPSENCRHRKNRRGAHPSFQQTRRSNLLRGLALGALVLGLAPLGSARAQSSAAAPVGNPSQCPWLNSSLPIGSRVQLIMQKMTVADEILMVEGQGTSEPYVFYMAGNSKLCMPPLGEEDGPNGVADGLKNVTQLPAGVSLAATFSRSLAEQYGTVIGAEQASKGSAVDLGPTVNIDRDPRWGRSFESLSEDPKLTAEIGSAEIIGIQSQRVMAQVKHFDAYNQEINRNTAADDVIVSDRVLHEIYEPAFRTAIRQAQAASVMCAYSSVDGFYSCQDRQLLTGVLRNQWNFQGFVTSDYGAIHDLSAATAGTDQEQPFSTYFGATLQAAVNSGTVPRAVLNSMVEPILTEMFRFHFFDNPPSGSTSATATTSAHVALSNTVAEDGTVLLRNQGSLLPLGAGSTIAVIGPAAGPQATTGGGGSAHVVPTSPVTPLAGIQAAAGGSSVTYAQGLPTDSELTAIPAADLSTAYSGTGYGGSYSATLTAPETGTYIIGFTNPCGCYAAANLSINGTQVISNPGTPPVATYSAAIQLTKGQTYSLSLTGETSNLAWATPSGIAPGLAAAASAAKAAKVAVVVVADDTETEAADRPNLSLPSAQDELISAVASANPHTVVVIQAGAPVTMPWINQVQSVLDTWYPGETDGTALAGILFGAADPSGHLPVTFPMSLADVPASTPAQFPGTNNQVQYSEGLLVGYRWYDSKGTQPLFPFGYGLSYTHFTYSNLQLAQYQVDGVTPIEVSATVTNDGNVAGSDAAQLYLGMPAATGEPPRKLVDFQRVTLAPGQSTVVHFAISPRDEWWWNTNGWDETAGDYSVYVGDSSALADLPLTARYTMTRSIGARHVGVTSPRPLHAGTTTTVQVTLGGGGNETLNLVQLGLSAPDGWSVVPLASPYRNNVGPGEVVTEQFAVTPPAGAVPQFATLYGTANFAPLSCAGTDEAAQVADDWAALDQALNRSIALGGPTCVPVRRHHGIRVGLTG